MNSVTLNVPHFSKVKWHNEDLTYIIGENGVGKTLLMNEMMAWCDSKDYAYAHYYAPSALSEANDLIDNSDDQYIISACKMMSKLSVDFQVDVMNWGHQLENTTYEDSINNADLLRKVLHLAGAGYTRLFVMTIKALFNYNAYYFMDMPETSSHIHLARLMTSYFMYHFKYMKIVIVTLSPDMLDENFFVLPNDDDLGDENKNVIELPADYIEEKVTEMA